MPNLQRVYLTGLKIGKYMLWGAVVKEDDGDVSGLVHVYGDPTPKAITPKFVDFKNNNGIVTASMLFQNPDAEFGDVIEVVGAYHKLTTVVKVPGRADYSYTTEYVTNAQITYMTVDSVPAVPSET